MGCAGAADSPPQAAVRKTAKTSISIAPGRELFTSHSPDGVLG